MTDDLRELLHPDDLFHTGIVVDDLHGAKAELGALLGLTWREGGAEVELITDAGSTRVTTAYVLSREGPHHVELVQSIAGTLWIAAAPGQTHHLGWFVDSPVDTGSALVELGGAHLGTIALTTDAPPMCSYYRMPSGLCVEVVDRSWRRMLLGREATS